MKIKTDDGVLTFGASDDLRISRINATGNLDISGNQNLILDVSGVGIGQDTPTCVLHIASTNPRIRLENNDVGRDSIADISASSGSAAGVLYLTSGIHSATGGEFCFRTSSNYTTTMEIDKDAHMTLQGSLLLGRGGNDYGAMGSHGRRNLFIQSTYGGNDSSGYGWWIGGQNQTLTSSDNDLYFEVMRDGVSNIAALINDNAEEAGGVRMNFTGQHRCRGVNEGSVTYTDYIGYIVCSTGTYNTCLYDAGYVLSFDFSSPRGTNFSTGKITQQATSGSGTGFEATASVNSDGAIVSMIHIGGVDSLENLLTPTGYSSGTVTQHQTSGQGTGFIGTITMISGRPRDISIISKGSGYCPGDTITLAQSGSGNNATVKVSTVYPLSNGYRVGDTVTVVQSGSNNNVTLTVTKIHARAYISTNNAIGITINDALPVVTFSSSNNDKSVFGVISGKEDNGRKMSFGSFGTLFDKVSEDNRLFINSIGEGAIWVCSINGNFANGDYITTCVITGLGAKQSDDILHNYTVAKITCPVDFSSVSSFVNKTVVHNNVTYTCAFVGCTYHCG